MRSAMPRGLSQRGDGVSPILITGNDFAGAWATTVRQSAAADRAAGRTPARHGLPRRRQHRHVHADRELQIDQVHIPALSNGWGSDMITFAPFLPLWAMIAIGIVAALLAGFGLFRRMRGAWLRAMALALLVLAIANPSFVSGKPRAAARPSLPVVVDRSQSQLMPERVSQTDAALKDLTDRPRQIPRH